MAFFRNYGLTYIPRPIPEEPGIYPPITPQPEPTDPGSTPVIVRPVFSGGSTVKLYNNADDNNVLDKNPELITSVTVAYNQAVDIHNPILVVDTGNTDLSVCNYAYIEDLGRYYYIDSITMMQGGMYTLSMHVDVLKTFSSGIKQCVGIVERTEDSRYVNPELTDGSIINEEGLAIKIDTFQNGFLDIPVEILVVAGGGY